MNISMRNLMIKRKTAKGDMTCHSKPHFCFVWTNIIKMVMQSGYSFLKRKIIFAALLIVFFFQKICYLETLILRYVFHRTNIYSRFYDMLTDIWSGTGCAESVKKMLPTLTVNNDIILNMSHHIMISAE